MIIQPRSILFLLGFFLTVSFAAQKKSRSQLEADRSRIEREIKMVDKLLFENQTNEKNALDALNDLNQKIAIKENYIETITIELTALSLAIDDYESRIKKLTKKLIILKKEYATIIYKSYKSKSQQSRIMFLFSSESFYQAYKRLKYMKQDASFRKKQGEELVSMTDKLKQLKDSLQVQKQFKDVLLLSEEEQKKSIEIDKLDQRQLLEQIKKQESTYRTTLQRKQQEEKKLSDRIDKIIKEAIVKSSAVTDPSKSKRFTLTPEAKVLAARFEQNKGKLPWPVKSGLIIRRFGKQPHPMYPGNSIYSSGIHIATERGTDALAIFSGQILAIQTQSEGKKSVLIRHGNYISVYNNLENAYVRNEEKVITGQPIGKIFTNRVTGQTKLIFVLSKNTTRLNPANWILSR